MSGFIYPKGSEWRKWDLHIHTPLSISQQYGDGTRDEVWESFINDLESLPKEFKVIGINDYIFIDGYKKVLDYKRSGRLSNIELILPVIEFRLKLFAGTDEKLKKINFHVIFSDKIEPDVIEGQFLCALTSKYVITPGLNGSFWRGVISKESLRDLGKKIKESVPPKELEHYGSDIIEGFNNLVVDESDIFNILNESSYFKEGNSNLFITAIGKTEWDALHWTDRSIAEKKNIINKMDFVFISAENVEHYNRAKEKLTNASVNDLLLDCSDAHHFSTKDNVKDKIGKCFTWIKGDPTFEGLKQIIFEKDDRIKIQTYMPEEKPNYSYIDKVRFIYEDSYNTFPKDYIQLNRNLNTIIGGKSAGKSLLLYHIGKSIDPKQVDTKNKTLMIKGYKYEKEPLFDFEVCWADGYIDKIRSGEYKRKIIYIPQMYISELVKEENRDNFSNLIQELILQDNILDEKYKEFQTAIANVNSEIEHNIKLFLNYSNDKALISESIKAQGDKQTVSSEIDEIKKKINDIQKVSDFTEPEIIEYEKLNKEKEELKNKIIIHDNFLRNYQNIFRRLNEMKRYSIVSLFDIDDILSNVHDIVDDNLLYKNIIEEFETKFNADIISVIDKYIEISIGNIENLEKENTAMAETYNKLVKQIMPFNEKGRNKEILKEMSNRLDEQYKLLNGIIGNESNFKMYDKMIEKTKDIIIKKYEILFQEYNKIARIIKGSKKLIHNVDLVVTVDFNVDKFENDLMVLFDKRSDLGKILGDNFIENKYVYKNETHNETMGIIFENINNDKIKIRTGNDKQDVIDNLFADYYIIRFNLKKDEEDIYSMSPGQRGIILLQLYLSLAEGKYPILIDQPEDNLDNRSIYTELKKHIKEVKIERQIIIVTHNANFVVSTDAEEVIVASQAKPINRDGNREFIFEYVSGSLESSFENNAARGILYKRGVRQHVCEILEGGRDAFLLREMKYGFKK